MTPGQSQPGQSSPIQLAKDLIGTFQSQGDQIDTSMLRQQQDQIHRVSTQVVSSSGAQEARLEEAGTHRTLMSASQLPGWAKTDLSKIMWLTDKPQDYGTDRNRVEQALTSQIQPLTQIMTQIGLNVPSEASSYAASGKPQSERKQY